MGEYIGRDSVGAPILFKIKGDKPDPAEMGRITDILTKGPPQTAVPEPEAAPEAPGILSTFGSGIARGWNEIQAGVDTGMQSFYETLGDDPVKAKEWEEAAQAQNKQADTYAAPGSILDSDTSKVNAIVGTIGQSAPSMALGLGGMGIGTAIGGAIGSFAGPLGTVAGGVVGGAIGGALGYGPQMLNANAERQIEQHGHVKDWGKAYASTAIGAGIETITDKIGLKVVGALWDGAKIVGKAIPKTTEKVVREASKNAVDKAMTVVSKKVGTGVGLGALTGAAEETIQAGLERWQAELPLMDDAAKKEYLESAIMGGIVESIFGGGAGAYGASKQIKSQKAYQAAKDDIDAEAARLASATRSYGPQYEEKRNAPYKEAPPVAEPVREPIKDPGRLLADFSAPTREQTMLNKEENQLPPGLRDAEVGEGPLEAAGEQPTSVLSEARQEGPVSEEAAASAVRPTIDRSKMSREEYKAAMQARQAEDLVQAAKRGEVEAIPAPAPITSVEPVTDKKTRTVPPVSPVTPIAPAPTTPSTAAPRIGEHGPTPPPFSDEEYRHAIDTLRDEGTLSHDKIAKVLGVSKPQAEAYFAEMLKRNDAYPAGNQNQYAKITVPKGMSSRKQHNMRGKMSPYRARDYIVKPVRPATGMQPYSVHVNGKRMGQKGGNTFATRAEAQAFIDTKVPAGKKKDATVVEDMTGIQYGIHELQYEHLPNKEQRLIGEQVVNTFMTEAEAQEAIKDYDPAYSPESNKQKKQKLAPEERAAAINRDFEQATGSIGEQLRTMGEKVLGPGRLELGIAPRIVDPKNPDAIIEGSSQDLKETNPEGVRRIVGNLIRLSHDLYNPSLTEEQRTKLMEEVMNHELVHALRGLDLLTKQEWDTLFQHAATAKVPGKPYTWLQRAAVRAEGAKANEIPEEAIAEMVRHYINDPTAFRNPTRGLLRKIADFIKKMIRLGERHDAADLIDTIFSGGIADRQIGHGGLGPRNKDDVQFSLLKTDNFYLETERFLQKVTTEEAPKNHWIKMLSSAGIKPEELNWLGVKQWLQDIPVDKDPNGRGGLVHRNDILNFVKASGPNVEPVIFARKDHPDLAKASIMDPRWEDRTQVKDDKTYAEVAFTYPSREGEHDYAGAGDHIMVPGERVGKLKKLKNVLAFARFRDVVEDGKRILFIEEMQSDLHQKGSMNGYYSKSAMEKYEAMRAETMAAYDERMRLMNERNRLGDEIWMLGQEENKLRTNARFNPTLGMSVPQLQAKKLEKQQQLADITAVEKEMKDKHEALGREQGAFSQRLEIPNAPFKSNWEDYVIRRMIRHAVEHNYDGIAWHGSPESVAETEGYGDLEVTQDERGRDQYKAYGMTPVSPIVNRYMLKLPRITRGIAEPFGVNLDHNKVDESNRPPTWMGDDYGVDDYPNMDRRISEVFASPADFRTNLVHLRTLHESMIHEGDYLTDDDKELGQHLIDRLARAHQIAINRRSFDAPAIIDDAGINAGDIDHILSWTNSGDFYAANASFVDSIYAEAGKSFRHDNYRLMFNSAMSESFERGDQPFFSMVRERGREVQADPNFQKWFGAGVVTEDDGTPKIVYHSTRAKEDFSRFRRLTHWGTAEAANDRQDAAWPLSVSGSDAMTALGIPFDQQNKQWAMLSREDRENMFKRYWKLRDEKLARSRIYPAFLNLRRPLEIYDTGVQHTAKDYALAAHAAGGLTDSEVNSINRRFNIFGEKAALSQFIKLLEKKGYDGLMYENQAEDLGSMSYVTFKESQQKSIFNRGTWDEANPDIMYSRLQERGADLLENNDKFKHWFGGSRIVDEDGNPYLMFHGTAFDFDTFDPETFGTATDDGWYGRGFYFSPDPGFASVFAKRPVISEMPDTWTGTEQNFPKETDLQWGSLGEGYNKDFAYDKLGNMKQLYKARTSEGARVIPVFLSIKNPFVWQKSQQAFVEAGKGRKFVEDLKRSGYDGIVVPSRGFEAGETDAPKWIEVVAFEAKQIKSAMAEEFSIEEDSYKYSMVKPRYSAAAPLGQRVPVQPPLDQLSEVHNKITYDNLSPWLHKIIEWTVPGGVRKAAAKGKVDDTIISLQDRMLSIGRLIDRMKKNGGFITNENDTYLREQLYSSQVDAHLTANDRDFYKKMTDAISGLHVTQRDVDEAKTIDEKVATILKQYPNPKHALAELYLYAQHARERNALMRQRNEHLAAQGIRTEQHSAGSGLGDGTSQAVLDWFASKPFAREFNDPTYDNSIRSRMRAIVANTNDIRVASGLTPEFRNMLGTDGLPLYTYEDYVPIRGRIDEEATYRGDDEVNDFFAKTGKGFNIRGKEDFSALGRESLGRDMIAHAIMQNQEAIVRAGKNKVAQSFRQLILDNPTEMAGVAEIIDRGRTKYAFDAKRGVVRQVIDNKVMTDPTILKGKVEGQQFFIKLHDDKMVKAMGSKSGLGSSTGMHGLLKGMLGVNRFLAATRTSYNPEFMIANMMRDLEAAMINLSESGKKGVRRKVMASVFPALKGVRDSLRSGNPTGEWAKVHEEFRRHGGHTAVFGIRELADTIDHINDHLSEDVSGNISKVKQPIRWLGKFISDYNLAIENGTRLAAYKVLRDQYLELSGDPHDAQNQLRAREMAAFAAKNLTVNFNMGGESKGVLSAFYMFFNASMQGTLALLNPFIRSRRMKMVWASVLTAGAVQDMLMSMLSPEDDDGEKTYDKIPEHILEHNLIFMDPFGISERGYFKMPMPYLMNGIYNFGRAASRTARGKYTAGELLSTGGMTLIDSLNPLGGSNSWLNLVAPSVIDPFVDLSLNEDFTGTPIAPPVSPYDNVGENRSQQYWSNTNPAYIKIADWMSQLTGRKGDFIPGYMEASPNQVEYAVDWVTGGTGTFLARAGRLIYGGATGDLPEMEIEATDIPFLRKAYGSITKKNDLQDYIEGRDQVLRIRKALQDARKEGDNEGYMQIMREYPKEYKIASKVNAIENARKKLSSHIKKIRESKRIPEEVKEARIKELKARQDLLIGRGNETLAAID